MRPRVLVWRRIGTWVRSRRLRRIQATRPALERVVSALPVPLALSGLRRARLVGAWLLRRPPWLMRSRVGPDVRGRRVGARDDDVARARIGLAGGEGEVVGRVAGDLEPRLVR